MSFRSNFILFATVCAIFAMDVRGDDPALPNRVPVTRPEMKQSLEDLKKRSPRIPPPELTDDEKAKAGERAASIEGRLRARYLPYEPAFGSASREPDPKATLSYEFKTRLFWIVSRLNNCHY